MMRLFEIVVFYCRLFLMLIWVIVSALVVLPLALFRWKNAENNSLFARVYAKPALALMGIRIRMEGASYLETRPAIFVANHQSGLDLAVMSGIYPPGSVVIGKKELRLIPVFGLMFEAFGNILIDRQDRSNALSGLNQAVATMKRGNLSAWIFPEGTRNPAGDDLLPFKKGAFYMAIQSQSPIVPIVCSRLERLVSFKRKASRRGELIIRVLPPISTVGLTNSDVEPLLRKTRETMRAALLEINTDLEAQDRAV